jgi:class 3 adenylate cyclase
MKNGYSELKVGIGMSYGSSLLIKSGYKGSGINEVVWLGKLVSEAALLRSHGNKSYGDYEMMVSNLFYENLNDNNKNLLSKNTVRDCYHGDVINRAMNE